MIMSIIVAITVPVASLRTTYVMAHCCCPDPAFCHCPDHGKQLPSTPTMRDCHRTEVAVVSPELASFVPERVANVTPRPMIAPPPSFVLDTPHVSPFPARPDAPS